MNKIIFTPSEQRLKFIELRAEGLSYDKIAKKLHISKSTCSSWEKEFQSEITKLKHEQLRELYDNYYMTKEARIKKLGSILNRIDDALDEVDLSEVPADKLLDYKLKYTEALKGEYIWTAPTANFDGDITPKEVLNALGDLMNRVRAGEVTPDQANRESSVLINMLKALDIVEMDEQISALAVVIKEEIGVIGDEF